MQGLSTKTNTAYQAVGDDERDSDRQIDRQVDRLDWIRLDQIRIDQIRLDYRLDQIIDQIRLDQNQIRLELDQLIDQIRLEISLDQIRQIAIDSNRQQQIWKISNKFRFRQIQIAR